MTERNALSSIRNIEAPIIPLIADLIAKHPGTISLGQGTVYYGPPQTCLEQLGKFLSNPLHRYQQALGLPELRELICHKLRLENSIFSDGINNIIVTPGANMAFMNAVLAITNPGDEIILPSPFFFSNEVAIRLAGCTPVFADCDENYQIKPCAIEKVITRRTKAVVTISPNNPTGAVYTEQALRQVNALCHERKIYHISDEAYEYFTYSQTPHFSPASIQDAADHTISLFSFSKAYGLASWRVGYMVAPTHLTENIKTIQDTLLICPPVASQYAALGCIASGRKYCDDKIHQIRASRAVLLEQLESVSDICRVPNSEGSIYLLAQIASSINELEFVKRLIQEHGVAVLPGAVFGAPTDPAYGCRLRIAFGSVSKDELAEATSRLCNGIRAIAS